MSSSASFLLQKTVRAGVRDVHWQVPMIAMASGKPTMIWSPSECGKVKARENQQVVMELATTELGVREQDLRGLRVVIGNTMPVVRYSICRLLQRVQTFQDRAGLVEEGLVILARTTEMMLKAGVATLKHDAPNRKYMGEMEVMLHPVIAVPLIEKEVSRTVETGKDCKGISTFIVDCVGSMLDTCTSRVQVVKSPTRSDRAVRLAPPATTDPACTASIVPLMSWSTSRVEPAVQQVRTCIVGVWVVVGGFFTLAMLMVTLEPAATTALRVIVAVTEPEIEEEEKG